MWFTDRMLTIGASAQDAMGLVPGPEQRYSEENEIPHRHAPRGVGNDRIDSWPSVVMVDLIQGE
jgi:hypothetical protein